MWVLNEKKVQPRPSFLGDHSSHIKFYPFAGGRKTFLLNRFKTLSICLAQGIEPATLMLRWLAFYRPRESCRGQLKIGWKGKWGRRLFHCLGLYGTSFREQFPYLWHVAKQFPLSAVKWIMSDPCSSSYCNTTTSLVHSRILKRKIQKKLN